MYIIAGLGNPTRQYEHTRHNVGFDVISKMSEKYRIPLKEKKHKAVYGSGVIAGQKVLLVQPQTYMEAVSGRAFELL